MTLSPRMSKAHLALHAKDQLGEGPHWDERVAELLRDYDGRDGAIAVRRTFVEIDPRDGLPDGMTVDAEGGVWICLFGGAAVRRYSPDGRLEAVIRLPVTNPTSAAFGGAELTTLYVTTARHRLAREQLAAEPLASAVLAVNAGLPGLAANRFAG